MSPTIEDGDLALVEPGVEPQDGKVCFATFPGEDGDRVVKRFRRLPDGTILLESDNRDHPTLALNDRTGAGVRIYRVTWLVKPEP
ncbi:MAG: S24 family peptidase [Proteobacteria bacterium]|nr:S24 family peptidase [Pseudomonadota bacterium]